MKKSNSVSYSNAIDIVRQHLDWNPSMAYPIISNAFRHANRKHSISRDDLEKGLLYGNSRETTKSILKAIFKWSR